MTIRGIDLLKTGYFPELVTGYLNSEKNITPFYSYPPAFSSVTSAAFDKFRQPVNRNVLTEVLLEQYGNGGISLHQSRKVHDNILSLKDENTFTITTGHQLCFCTGPLYSIYKIISAIKIADGLNAATESALPSHESAVAGQRPLCAKYRYVPVFWMVSEDHDFEEINHIHIFGKKLEWKRPAPIYAEERAKNPPAGIIKTKGLESLLNELESLIGKDSVSGDLPEIFRRAYLHQENLADATRWLLHELFGKYGLVIIDGNDYRLKKQFLPVMLDDIFRNKSFQLISRTNTKLGELNIKPQINPREINCFYMTDEIRERIVMKEDSFNVLNSTVSFKRAELENELFNHPEKFSPNVSLRPLFQATVLPDVAYIGGPNELAYWLQMKGPFDHYGVLFPVLIPRLSALWIDANASAKMKKFGFSAEDIFLKENELIKNFILKNSTSGLQTAEEENKIASAFDLLASKGEAFDKTLSGFIAAEKQKALKSVKTIEEKLIRAEKRKNEETVNQIKKLKWKLFPPEGAGLQERQESFVPYYLTAGDKFFNILLENFNAFEGKMKVFIGD